MKGSYALLMEVFSQDINVESICETYSGLDSTFISLEYEITSKTLLNSKALSKRSNLEMEKIISFMENIEKQVEKLGKSTDKKSVNEMITKLMKGASKGGNSKITAAARGLNSIPGLLTTIFISPYILGWFIPRLTYRNTRRIHAKEDRERALQEQQKLRA